jgi:predicted TIM-barrel fold metal-dependent hydrolase
MRCSTASALRSKLGHPVIDVDGHHLEYLPALDRHLKAAMGDRLFYRWLASEMAAPASLDERRSRRAAQPGWWTATPVTELHDRAASALPRLLRHRMDDLGIDFMIMYTSVGLRGMLEPDDEVRRAFCSAMNRFYADYYLVFGDRLTPACVIPMFTPEEALAELDRCHGLGFKVVHMAHGIPRPIPDIHRRYPELYPGVHWLDTFGLDSEFDYDVVWRRLTECGFAATFHGHSAHASAVRSSRSPSNYVFNHLGAHGTLMQEVCKSLILGGVTNRFQSLQFAFLEGGVHWACGLVNDFIEHWERRNIASIHVLDPQRLDRTAMKRIIGTWGDSFVEDDDAKDSMWLYANRREGAQGDTAAPANRDDFAACELHTASDIQRLFGNMYFGAEADDRTVHCAFRPFNSMSIRLRAMFSSDYGHWDVGVPAQLLLHSYDLVREELLSSEEFREFVADNAIRLHGTLNRTFWQGTVVEGYASEVLGPAGKMPRD